MKALLIGLICVGICIPLTGAAHDGAFFEYAPDAWASKRHSVSSAATPYQLFQLETETTLTGFDLWLDNTGSSGPVTFAIADEEGNTLSTKVVTLPSIAATSGGTKYHVDLSSPLSLGTTEVYSIQIASALPGLGLYYADKINLLEHNKNYLTAYGYGTARLGSEEQGFTFKFALRSPAAVESEEQEQVIEEEEEPEEPAPTATVVSITNARIVAVTGSSVTIAWSTNIAANSRVSLRTQLNPLYVTHTTTDSTFELEHTVTVTGISPSTNYYADIYSANAGEVLLTTYTLSFQTTAATPTPTQTVETPAATPTTPTATTPVTPTTPEPDEEIVDITPSSDIEGLPALVVTSDNGTVQFTWQAPESGEPANGYRIDVFDSNQNLIRSIYVPAGTHHVDIEELASGKHYAVVYAQQDEVFEKVATPTAFTLQKKGQGFNIFIGITLVWLAGMGGYMLWKSRKPAVAEPQKSDTLVV